jgi:hypothetical protein
VGLESEAYLVLTAPADAGGRRRTQRPDVAEAQEAGHAQRTPVAILRVRRLGFEWNNTIVDDCPDCDSSLPTAPAARDRADYRDRWGLERPCVSLVE